MGNKISNKYHLHSAEFLLNFSSIFRETGERPMSVHTAYAWAIPVASGEDSPVPVATVIARSVPLVLTKQFCSLCYRQRKPRQGYFSHLGNSVLNQL